MEMIDPDFLVLYIVLDKMYIQIERFPDFNQTIAIEIVSNSHIFNSSNW